MGVQRLFTASNTVPCGQLVHMYDPRVFWHRPLHVFTSTHSSISAAAAAYFSDIEINKLKMIPTVENSGFLPMTINFHVN